MLQLSRLLCCIFALVTFTLVVGASARAGDGKGWAQLADFDFQQIAPDNVLPNSASPQALAEDGDGFFWIASENGLARWDGYRFRDYQPDPKTSGSLPDNDVQTLHTDIRGRLWIGMNSAGLARYERDEDRFVSYSAGQNGLSDGSVSAIADDGAGGLWVGTGGGLDHLDPNSGAIIHLRRTAKDPRGLPNDTVDALLLDRAGNLWVGTSAGLARQGRGSSVFETIPLPATNGEVPAVRCLLEDSGGRIWVGTVNHGAYRIDPTARRTVLIRETSPPSFGREPAGVNAIAEAGPDEVWLGTSNQGIIAVDTVTLRTRRIRHDPRLPSSLPDDIIRCLYRDRAGLIWTGTTRSLTRRDARQRAVSTIFGDSSRPDSISDRDVHAVLPMPDGRVWLGLGNNGVDIIDPAGTRVAALRPDPDRPNTALPLARIDALALAPTGDVFVGTAKGLYRSDSSAQKVVRVALPPRSSNARVFALSAGPGVLWIGALDGLWRLDLKRGGAVARIGHAGAQRLTDQRIRVIEPGRTGLWIGTENGLNRLDPISHRIERILPNLQDPGALINGYITCILTDRQGRVWVGTGGGIAVLESRDASGRPRFRQLGMAQGLPNDDISKLFEDRRGNVWASTDEGLVVIDPKTFAMRALRRAEGAAITYYWLNSGAATPEGELLFGGLGGITAIDPNRLTDWTYDPPLVVTDARVGGVPVPASRFNGGAPARPLTVTPEANSLRVEFSALDYSAPERNIYAYRLRGFDNTWIYTDPTNRLAVYTNLPPGDYSLELRGSNRDGAWSQTRLVPIRVLPAWYQTIWFQLAAALAGLIAVAMLVQARTAFLRRREHELERQVAERTSELHQRTVALRESQLQLEHFAFFDALTGLPNRRMFNEDFLKFFARVRREGGRFALLLIDLDGFKHINDTLGHDAGDALLIETGSRLRAIARGTDCVARLGGDEFVILLAEGQGAANAIESVCRRIVESFTVAIPYNGTYIATTCSIGIAECPEHGETQDSLYKCADLALYDAKRAGRNTWHQYSAGALRPPYQVTATR
jgi:diguanylate cyclase (GGDEF)-like protein